MKRLLALFHLSPWLRHLPGGQVIDLDTGRTYPCQCSRWRVRCQLLAQAVVDVWRT